MFIEVSDYYDGTKRLINTDWITDISYDACADEKYAIIWIGNSFADYTHKILCDESYEELREMLIDDGVRGL